MRTRVAFSILVFAGLMAVAPAADAAGVVLDPGALAPHARATLVASIKSARSATPDAFARVAALRAELADLDAQKRGRLAPITPRLKALGPDALFPMLEELAVDAAARGGLADTAWLTWQLGLVEAVGMLRDARSAPVLAAILDTETDPAIVGAAAGAYGKLGSDAVVKKLVAMASAKGDKGAAVLGAMGSCRRAAVAQALAQRLAAQPDADTAKRAIHALGDVGSAWAWQTPIIAASGEEASTRAAAAKALVAGFVAYQGDVRQAASNALMVVDDASTPALIAAAKKGASSALAADLDQLAQRFAKNPTR